ncbi:MAG TPA: monovalent cation:proton antiporter-2 (CPA2) family protein [Woeseiaceae bacterium]|nr:monovalent cation:proton antiporter-2 (CPA2) family protein [Woeseiaceae bacterium]
MTILQESIIYLLAAIISVPISKRLGFGSVLGYLCAGILIGPFGLGFIHEPEHILHFAELGVVFLLFIIGLELKPTRLWVMRKMVFGLGTAQVLVSAALIAALVWLYGLEAGTSVVIGLILALSSTAFVLQMLAEKKQLNSQYGRAAFSILLLQDLAVIPLIAILPLLGTTAGLDSGFDTRELVVMIGTLVLLIVGGRLALKPVLKSVAAAGIPELFTATALLVVIGSALLMEFAGMSMVLGAFIAGMLLADSEYRHQLEADIAPFKGLLLGLFFIAVGMSVNISLLLEVPGRILLFVAGLMLSKAVVLFVLARMFGICDRRNALSLATVMSQGGEFAFVLFALAARERLVPAALIDELILAVAVSMLLTPFVYLLNERFGSKLGKPEAPPFDEIPEEHHDVIIAGFGRVGQIVGRLLQSINRPFTALEIDSSQVDIVRRYGNSVHFGDAARPEVLRAAGAAHARILVLATADMETSLHIAETAKRQFPNLAIIARAHNRRHAHKLMDVGVDKIFRDTLLSSLAMGESVLEKLGFDETDVRRVSGVFRDADEKLLIEQYAMHESEEKLIQSAKDAARELEAILEQDLRRQG